MHIKLLPASSFWSLCPWHSTFSPLFTPDWLTLTHQGSVTQFTCYLIEEVSVLQYWRISCPSPVCLWHLVHNTAIRSYCLRTAYGVCAPCSRNKTWRLHLTIICFVHKAPIRAGLGEPGPSPSHAVSWATIPELKYLLPRWLIHKVDQWVLEEGPFHLCLPMQCRLVLRASVP